MPYYYRRKSFKRILPPSDSNRGHNVAKPSSYKSDVPVPRSVPKAIKTPAAINAPFAPAHFYGPIKRYQCTIRRYDTAVDVRNKSFGQIKAECLKRNILFEDPEFPADDESLFFSSRPSMRMKWKRPYEIATQPELFVGGASRFDIVQGELGDCWLLAAIASLSLNKELLYRIIPPEQSFKEGEYAGIFHFQFWQYGQWVDVIVDDLLPTYNGKLVYLHSAERNEFWSALLEKAYAKLNGSFEALKGGSTAEAMEDFTGGLTEIYELNNSPGNLYHLMELSLKKGALMGCAIETKSSAQMESKLSNGLLMGHAYSVTGVDRVRTGEKLVRVRNPWGQVEWNGAWSDASSKWRSVPEDKKRMDVEFNEDGEFWMSFSDFCRSFTKLEICNLGPDALEDDDFSTQWVTSLHEGRWIRGCTAGGCRNYPDTFWTNPQFRLTLEEEDDDPDDNVVGCSFIVSLMQKNRRKQKSKGQNMLTIGFALYRLTQSIPPNHTLKKDFFLYHQSTARSKQFINLRENSQRFKLPPGEYVIIPSTFQPNEEADFVLRLYTEKRSHVDELDEETKQVYSPDNTAKDEPPPKDTKKEESPENERNFKALFDQLTGEDGEIDAFELQDIVNSVIKKNMDGDQEFDGFSVEACRSMLALLDETESGKLDFDEFKQLWVRVRKWINIFKKFDKDRSGAFDTFELRDALSHAGFSLNGKLYQKLCVRYASRDLTINMDDFILLSVKLESMFHAFNKYRDGGNPRASLTLQEWLDTTMYS